MKVFKWIWETTGKQKWLVLLTGILQGTTASLGIVFALLMRRGIDTASSGESEAFRWTLVVLSSVLVLQVFLRSSVRFCTEESRSALENRFRLSVFQGILEQDYRETSFYHTGELMNRITADSSIVADSLVTLFPSFVDMVVKISGVLLVMGVFAPWLAALLFTGGILMALVSAIPRKYMKHAHHQVQEEDGKVRSILQESLGNVLMICAFGCQKKIVRQGEEAMKKHRKVRRRRNFLSNGFSTGMNAVFQGAYLTGFIWGTSGILHGTVSYGTLTAVIQLIGQIQAPFVNLGGVVSKLGAMSASAERMMELMVSKEESSLRTESVSEIYEKTDRICFSHIFFRYTKEENWVLKDSSFSLKKGGMTAIVGHSGIGKSTIMKLLLSIYKPEKGEIFFQMKERHLPVSSAPEGIFAYVPQGNALMSGTIAEVVGFAEKEEQIDEKKIEESCKTACAWEFISQLPNGIHTRIGERGAGLSEGQMQRLAVARAIYSGCPILLLDEATSALDADTEKQMIRELRKLSGRTIFLITHRREAWELCDQILVQGE